ncbi:DNA-deoxyinosine glycosylase [Candidatus Methylospira mobilis]|uniref:DNA-deoxyinosine glycosylase n=1 Tax=Candidatus Methylospira mobilis TaxID=1808979 RepID=UPI0028E1CB40|nr:DNA-deoxyinosine glycosylase [Candidatus Methylospira mobilis]WNV05101.1 DNA-deoxyinosine glycosylase [Candidatus Methylospira mobilis]
MSEALAYSFEPIAETDAEILILGSMPGRDSLKAAQYYAHPRNIFWRIMAEILHFDAGAPYQNRTAALSDARIALWDVLHSCKRPGSLDSSIEADTVVVNDFQKFFLRYDRIGSVIFNGSKAEHYYVRRVLPHLNGKPPRYFRAPSTSPAHASLSYARKLEIWRNLLGTGR